MAQQAAIKKGKKKRFRALKKLVVWLIVLVIAALAVRFFVLPSLEAQATTTYEKYAAMRGDISNSLSFSGSISVKNSETHASSGDGKVRQIFVRPEEDVAEGQKLMRLSNGEIIRASFDGQVNDIAVEVGDEISANTNLIQIVDFHNLKVSMRVDEYSISEVSVGQKCSVSVTALGRTFESEITHINRISSSSGSTAYYTVTAELNVTDTVLPGMAVTVTIPQEQASNAVILSKDALSFDRNNSAYVLMDDGSGTNTMVQVPVEIGVDNDNYVEIVSGLFEGDEVYAVAQEATSSVLGMLTMFGGMNSGMPGNNFGGNADRGTGNSRSAMGGNMPGNFGGMPGGW